MNIHAIEERSRANGPGRRFVIWFQGCSLGCPGCYNPATHDAAPKQRVSADDVVARIVATRDIEGVTISGGEPFEQIDALAELVARLRERTALSVLVFSGYARDEIEAMPLGPAVLANIDVLIDGRYRAGERVATGLRGSANQQVHLLTERYTAEDIAAVPEAEIRIDAAGRVHLTGVAPLVLKD